MRIIAKDTLVNTQGVRITKIVVTSKHIAAKAQPGQFVVLMKAETSERIPLTVVDTDKNAGTITLIFQELGFSTKLFGTMNAGDSFYAVVGPLGHATEIKRYGNVILVGGGVGIAEIYPVARSLKNAGNTVTTILGSRTKDLLILENELRAHSDHFFVTTDDGSYGRKGFTTDVLKELLSKSAYDLIYVVGPVPMMRKAAMTTKEFNARTVVSLNALMVDATGMCGGCRVTVGNEAKFACVDGPEFDAHQVDWDELTKRNRVYDQKEKHLCNLHKQ
ncbi:MAG TPA: sulfide/dihydroorotate dehydrogenase-like FAD/NAD-binding protein [bacterium]|nr:sulfide/dihydroorotate dehydrogenase-like FAD/NAD-binding protein [bacterium]